MSSASSHQTPHERPAPSSRLDETADFDNGAEPVERRAEHPEKIGRFQVESVLGCGGFGTVYLAYDDELRRRVAVKVAHEQIVSSDEARDTFLSEARILAALDHPRIVPVYDVGRTDDGLCYVVSKQIDGHNLETEILSGRLTYEQTAQIVANVAEALDYAHGQGFVHRDIKPANVLVDGEANPYITDYGLALHEQGVRWGRLTGTPNYMSPEQARGESHLVDGRSDVYSLGAVFYKMLTGREPFFCERVAELLESIRSERPQSPRELDPSIPAELERICLKALEKRASKRYGRAGEMADDLRDWLAAGDDTAAPGGGNGAASGRRRARIVPKGLRSFDGGDADFFLQLLPGPFDRNGLPESIRFWKTLVEQTDEDTTFRAGLVYGPSGCGKSSMMKAGLLPQLADWVIPIYVEATPEETERRLLRAVQKRFPALSSTTDLPECLAELRAGKRAVQTREGEAATGWEGEAPAEPPGGPGSGAAGASPSRLPIPGRRPGFLAPGQKLLIVVDQFEQWLHTKQQYADSALVAALRQCDGERLQCVLLVRDDFWMAITRFLRELEVPLVEGRNSAAVDLFDLDHARKVLAEFGRAFDRLPDNTAEFTDEQTRFLDESVQGLARNERVIPVQLSLFAEMVKAKPWSPATLAEVGGAEGVGLTFLEETFSAAHAPPTHRLHQKAVRAVLSLLLPEKGHPLRGSMRSRDELLEASGYAGQPADFEAVLNILNELHLITPTDPEGAAFDESRPEVRTEGDRRYYQLTHEYLIPPLRTWLTRKQRETRRGRAGLLLDERASQWNDSQQNRLLPSLRETIQIGAYTRRADWTEPQRKMVRRAVIVHGRRLTLMALLIAALALLIVLLLPKPPDQFQLLNIFADPQASRAERTAAFDRLQVNDVHIFPRVLKALESVDDPVVGRHALDRLVDLANEAPESGEDGTDDSIRDPLMDLLLLSFERPSDELQRDAFEFYAQLAPPVDVVEMIRRLAGEVQTKTAGAMTRYVNELDLEGLDEEARSRVIQELTTTVRDSRHDALVEATVARFDELPPSKLLTWLMDSHEPWESKTAAKESLIPYLVKTNVQRRRAVGRHAEQWLVSSAREDLAGVGSPFRLEYLVQAVGQIAALREDPYDTALEQVAWLIAHRNDLSDKDILDTVIEAFVHLNHDKRKSLEPLRELLSDDTALWANREAAAVAVGDLLDLESYDTLRGLVADTDAVLNFRWRAAQSLHKLGSYLKREQPESPRLAEIVEDFHGLVKDFETQPVNLVRAALVGYGDLGHTNGAADLFPLLADHRFNVDAIVAVLTILTREPENTGDVVQAYLPWRVATGRLQNVPENPDRALVGFSHYVPALPGDEAGRAVAAALAGARAEMPDEACRLHAAGLLDDFLLDGEVPLIDPEADAETRETQLMQWNQWWDSVRDRFQLKAGQLVRASSTP